MQLDTSRKIVALGCLLAASAVGLLAWGAHGSRAASSNNTERIAAALRKAGTTTTALATIVVNSTADGQVSEVQQVTVSGVSGGSFTLTFNGQTTAPLPFNAFPIQVEQALNALPNIGGVGGGVRVTQSGNVYTIVFGGSLANTNVPQMTATGIGGTVAVVTTVQDPMLNCPGPNCTLRSAIAQAMPGDTIQFGPLFATPQTITLAGTEFFIEKDLTIQGPGANLLTLNGNGASRVFFILQGPNSTTMITAFNITISGLTIANGDASGSAFNNFAGGGIYNRNPGTLNLVEVFLSNNTATVTGLGGALLLDSQGFTVNLIRSTLARNTASQGGGIDIRSTGTLNVINSTIACNTAAGDGGGIGHSINVPPPAIVNLLHSTVVGNQAGGRGGGLHIEASNIAYIARNSIIALNTAPAAPDIDNAGIFISQGYNLIGVPPGGGALTQPTDQIGVNPQLALDALGKPLLANNGGPTPTISPLPGSPVIDAAGNTPFNEVQSVSVQGFLNQNDGFTLTFNGQTTPPLPLNATAAQVQAALNALSTLGGVGGSVTVIRFGFFSSAATTFTLANYLISFGGTLAGADLPALMATAINNSGSTFASARGAADGGVFTPLNTDQRGVVRPVDQPNVPNAPGSNGADIGAYELLVSPQTAIVAIADPLGCTGPGDLLNVSAQVSNPNPTAQTLTFTAALPAGLLGLPNTCVTNLPGGTCNVTATSVTLTGTLDAGQTVAFSYQVQVGDAATPSTTLCVDSVASFGGNLITTVQACTTVNCPSVGPGLPFPSASEVSDQKAGSVLVYNLYSSSAAAPNSQNTRLSITNTNPGAAIAVHLFFVDGQTCSIADAIICLTQNQTATALASDLDPGTTGYLVAVASDPTTGCPVNFNFLIGDAYVKLASGHQANLGAEAFSALAGGPVACDGNSLTATLNFDGVSYNRAPRVLAASSLPARNDGNDTLLVINRFGGNLATGASTLSDLLGLFYDDAENALSFTFSPGTCQFRSSLSSNFPRTTPRLDTFIPAGRSGWLRLYSASDIGLLGAVLNYNPTAGTAAGAFNQGRNLHKLTLAATQTLVIPIFPPNCLD